jgi:hypothetical protein
MRNAVPVPLKDGWLQRSVPPRHEPVWVRIGGTWRSAFVRCWGRGDGWECLIEAEGPRQPWDGVYVYDPRTIRPRYRPQTPDD